MITSLCGLPAVGKSTLAKQLQETCGYTMVKINSRWELFFLGSIYTAKHPLFSFWIFIEIIKQSNSIKMWYYKWMNLFWQHHAQYQKASTMKKALIVEGHYQKLYALFESPLSEQDLKKVVAKFPKGEWVFFFDIEEETRQHHIQKRGYESREAFGKAYQAQWKAYLVTQHEVVKGVLSADSTVTVLHDQRDIDNMITACTI